MNEVIVLNDGFNQEKNENMKIKNSKCISKKLRLQNYKIITNNKLLISGTGT